MSTNAPEANDLHNPSVWQETESGKAPAGSDSTDLKWTLGGDPPAAAEFPTDEERKILAEAAADKRIKAEEAERAEAEKALKAAKKKAASSSR